MITRTSCSYASVGVSILDPRHTSALVVNLLVPNDSLFKFFTSHEKTSEDLLKSKLSLY